MEMHADDAFTVAFDYASGATAERVQNPLWPVTELLFGSRMRKSIATVKAFGKRIVDRAIEDREKVDLKGSTAAPEQADEKLDHISGTLIQSLLDAIGDKQMVADAALNYLSAGLPPPRFPQPDPRSASSSSSSSPTPSPRPRHNRPGPNMDLPPPPATPLRLCQNPQRSPPSPPRLPLPLHPSELPPHPQRPPLHPRRPP